MSTHAYETRAIQARGIHTPDKDTIVSDSLSRSPVSTHDRIDLQEDVHVFVSEVVSSWPV